jgi:very-short-patch-repair endonuclease
VKLSDGHINRFRPDFITRNISSPHQRIIDLLNQHNIEFQTNTKNIIPPLELDIYIPSKNLAIEVNGIYWHSELAGGKDRHYHLNKTQRCEEQGIQLLQFWDVEIEKKWSIIESMIRYRLQNNTIQRIAARKCSVVDLEDTRSFLNDNHLQGYCQGSIKRGLIYDGNLIACLVASKPRYSTQSGLEIIRFCTQQNIQIQGEFSKPTHTLVDDHPSLISYADRRYSQGVVYDSSGWLLTRQSEPSYYYTRDYVSLNHRSSFQKHKLPKLLETFNPSLTEWENMKMNGYDRVWDCGTNVFTLNHE